MAFVDQIDSIKKSGNLYASGVLPSPLSAKDFAVRRAVPGASPSSFLHPAYRKLPVKNQQASTCVGNTGALVEEMFEYVESKRVLSFTQCPTSWRCGVVIQNSWGPQWGDGGFWRLGWDYVMSERVGEAWVLTDSPDAAGGYIRTFFTDVNAKERAVKHKPTATSTRPAVYLVNANGRRWIKDPFEAKRMGVNLALVEKLDDTDTVWDLPVIGPDAPAALR